MNITFRYNEVRYTIPKQPRDTFLVLLPNGQAITVVHRDKLYMSYPWPMFPKQTVTLPELAEQIGAVLAMEVTEFTNEQD